MEYEMNPYAVYVKRDEQGRIMNINSDAFLTDLTGWVKVDEGYTLRHCHAQGNYLPLPVYDERGICRYKLIEDAANEYGYAVQERTQEEMDAEYAARPAQPMMDKERIAALEAALSAIEEGIKSV